MISTALESSQPDKHILCCGTDSAVDTAAQPLNTRGATRRTSQSLCADAPAPAVAAPAAACAAAAPAASASTASTCKPSQQQQGHRCCSWARRQWRARQHSRRRLERELSTRAAACQTWPRAQLRARIDADASAPLGVADPRRASARRGSYLANARGSARRDWMHLCRTARRTHLHLLARPLPEPSSTMDRTRHQQPRSGIKAGTVRAHGAHGAHHMCSRRAKHRVAQGPGPHA